MPIEAATKHGQSSPDEGEKNKKQLDKEIREMVSTITNRVTGIHKLGSAHHLEDDDDEHGVRIVTLAGTNSGAILKSELDEKSSQPDLGEPEALSTYVNSNFQALNNSIMLGGSYDAHDPGVHVDISDLAEQIGHQKVQMKRGKKEKMKETKEKKKKEKEAEKEVEKEVSKSEHHSSHSD